MSHIAGNIIALIAAILMARICMVEAITNEMRPYRLIVSIAIAAVLALIAIAVKL
ncbi:MAG: hypothetical protein KGN35_12840 [Betaproteobacteria bacterium]|nr:hypothetical protein [Betaproteobacteria bacterium]